MGRHANLSASAASVQAATIVDEALEGLTEPMELRSEAQVKVGELSTGLRVKVWETRVGEFEL